MKTCSNCGSQIDEKNNFCPYCGAACESSSEKNRSVFKLDESKPYAMNDSELRANTYPMKWHKFLMVILILGGLLTIANGINLLLGSEYLGNGMDASRVYSIFPGLKSCDTFYGIALIALGVFEFIVRSRLNQYRQNGPKSLQTMYILSIVATLIYLAWASSATNINLLNSSSIGSLGASVLLLIINKIYYSKRIDLFVN